MSSDQTLVLVLLSGHSVSILSLAASKQVLRLFITHSPVFTKVTILLLTQPAHALHGPLPCHTPKKFLIVGIDSCYKYLKAILFLY